MTFRKSSFFCDLKKKKKKKKKKRYLSLSLFRVFLMKKGRRGPVNREGQKRKKIPPLCLVSLSIINFAQHRYTQTHAHLKGDIREETERKKGLSLCSLSALSLVFVFFSSSSSSLLLLLLKMNDSVREEEPEEGNRTLLLGENNNNNNNEREQSQSNNAMMIEEEREEDEGEEGGERMMTMESELEEKVTLSSPPSQNDNNNNDNNDNDRNRNKEKKTIQVPMHFSCPITFELMRDPVFIASGHTYDRRSITKWFQQGHKTCPSTGQRLRNTEITPNFALRNAILEWAKETKFLESEGEELLRNVSQKPTVQIGGNIQFGDDLVDDDDFDDDDDDEFD